MNLTKDTLKKVAEPVEQGADVSLLLAEMWRIMYSGRGVGLAANQIGSTQRVIVFDNGRGLKLGIINPVITKMYGGKHTMKEGCLSFPGIERTKVRSKQIIVEGFTPDWNPIKRKLKGFTARIVQHEVDHLNAITIIDEELSA